MQVVLTYHVKIVQSVVMRYKQMAMIFRLPSSLVSKVIRFQISTLTSPVITKQRLTSIRKNYLDVIMYLKRVPSVLLRIKQHLVMLKNTPKFEIFKLVVVSLNIWQKALPMLRILLANILAVSWYVLAIWMCITLRLYSIQRTRRKVVY